MSRPSIEAQVAALRVACAAVAGISGARISVGCSLSQLEVDLWFRSLPGATCGSFVSVREEGSKVIYSFDAVVDGVPVAGQGSRPAHPDDFKGGGAVWSAGTFRRLAEEEALAEALRVERGEASP